MATSCLKNVERTEIKRKSTNLFGAKIRDSISSFSPLRFGKKTDVGQVCILSRTNLSLFQAVVHFIGSNRANPMKIFIFEVIKINYSLNN
jgi:hypothetical protein